MAATSVSDTPKPHPIRALHIGITGHREGNRAYDANRAEVRDCLAQLFDALAQDGAPVENGAEGLQAEIPAPSVRVISCLAHGADLLAAELAQARGWQVDAPLPFGKSLNMAMNTPGLSQAQMVEAIRGKLPDDAKIKADWDRLAAATDYARCFELAEQDDAILAALEKISRPDADQRDTKRVDQQNLDLMLAERSAIASMVTIEQSDVLIAIWDGTSSSAMGGTRHTMNRALSLDVPVIWIDATNPRDPQLLGGPAEPSNIADIIRRDARERRAAVEEADKQFSHDKWHARSARRFHTYRRIDAVFGGGGKALSSLRQTYEPPQAIAEGSYQPLMAELRALPGADRATLDAIGERILPRFAFADGVSTYLSDAYRGGMAASFLLSAGAVVAGAAYLPFVGPELKWPFALSEFLLLIAIVGITVAGTRGQWHRRWFRTRRVAEYLRHAPIMISLGCSRAIGRWPKSRDASWPEDNARMQILSIGLPEMTVTGDYLRSHLEQIIRPFLVEQSAYHRAKSARLETVHRNLDRVSQSLFILAVISVGSYLILVMLGALAAIDPSLPARLSKTFTFLGVTFPTIGAALAGIRYFGDFERFASISQVTAAKLDRLKLRSDDLAAETNRIIVYRDFANLAHAMNDVVIEEIESWQSIFGTKKMAVPV